MSNPNPIVGRAFLAGGSLVLAGLGPSFAHRLLAAVQPAKDRVPVVKVPTACPSSHALWTRPAAARR